MFDTINGIPLHPLVVHAIVVLFPLAVVGTLVIAVRPQWRTRYGYLVVAAAAAATALSPVATASGEELQKRVGDPGYEHAELGEQLVWFGIVLLLASAALVFLQRRAETLSAGPGATAVRRPSKNLITVAAVFAIVAALATGYQVYRVGDSGAKSAWGNSGTLVNTR
jgi:uncharacterized membrane protein